MSPILELSTGLRAVICDRDTLPSTAVSKCGGVRQPHNMQESVCLSSCCREEATRVISFFFCLLGLALCVHAVVHTRTHTHTVGGE